MRIPVSVIIPYYNGGRFIADTLETVFRQTCTPLEIIVINDGSRPEDVLALEPFTDKVRILHQTNQGVSTARNRGIAAAGGEWIAFLDHDDHWMPDKLEKQWDYIREHPGCQAVHTAVKAIKRSGKEIIYRKKKLELQDFLYTNPNPAYLSSVLLKQLAIIEAGLFHSDFPRSQDLECFLRCSKKFSFDYIDEPLVIRHEHDSNISINYIKVWQANARIVKLHRQEYGSETRFKSRLLDIHLQFALRAMQARNIPVFFRILTKTMSDGFSPVVITRGLMKLRSQIRHPTPT